MGIIITFAALGVLAFLVFKFFMALFTTFSWFFQVVLRFMVCFILPVSASCAVYNVLGMENPGLYELGYIFTSLVYCTGGSLFALALRFAQSKALGYKNIGLGDLLIDTGYACFFYICGPIVAFVLRLHNLITDPNASVTIPIFLLGVIMCTIISTYGCILLGIFVMTRRHEDDLFYTEDHPGKIDMDPKYKPYWTKNGWSDRPDDSY